MSRKQKKLLIRIIAAAAIFAAGLFVPKSEEMFSALWFARLFVFLAAYFTAGWDVLWKSIRNIAHGHIFDEDFLMTIASIGAMIIGEYSEGTAVMLFFQIGELFQSVAVGKSRKSISDMMDLSPDYANVERNGEIIEVEPDEVEIGETIIVKAGEKIPLDGVVSFGSSGLNTAALTGESALRDVTVGDEVISGSVNSSGLLKITVTKRYTDSTVAKILELVENSSANKAKTENFITRFAAVYTPIVVISAVLLAIIPPLFVGNWSDWIYRALTFLVVSCPCALVISVPLSYFGGIGGASKRGIMVKGANYLEALSKAKLFVFDKTGTLTKGSFAVSEVCPVGVSNVELLKNCATAEQFSNHPLAVSVVNYAKTVSEIPEIPKAENAEELAGRGVTALAGRRRTAAGNARLMREVGVAESLIPDVEAAGTVIHCAVDGEYYGYIVVADEIKEHSRNALAQLKKLGAEKTVMLTGDRKAAADKVAFEVGIDEVHSQLLPDGKVELVEKLYLEKPPKSALCFVGDGMNDAPSLARADVGIAMGGLGSDAAIEAADIVLMNDNIENIPLGVKIARKTHRIVKQNIVFALAVKLGVLLLTAFGFANMWAAVFADVGVSVIAILNAMRAMHVDKSFES